MLQSSLFSIFLALVAITCAKIAISALSIDVGGEVTARPDVEVEFDLDPDSKLQWSRYASSRSDRPVLDGRSTLPDGEPVGINTRPIGTKKSQPGAPTSTVLEPSGFNFGRGVAYATTEDVQVGDELLSLPLSKVMTLQSAAKGRVGLLLEVNPELPPAIALALHLLEERALGVNSNFSDFVATLPPNGGLNGSMFYSEEEREELQGSQLYRYTKVREQAVEAFYDALLVPLTSVEAVDPPIFRTEDFTLENFRWAMGVVWASAFPVGPREEEAVLAPFLDTIGLCTEDDDETGLICPSSRVKLDTDANRLIVYATSPYKKGQEVRLTMSDKPSAQLMLNNGFVRSQPSKKLDKLEIAITLDPDDALIDIKNFMLQSQLNETINGTYALYYDSATLGDSILTSLKMKLLSGSEMPRFKELLPSQEEDRAQEHERRILSLRNEFVFTRAIMSTCKTLLEQYSTSLKEDEDILAELTANTEQDHTRKIELRRMLVLEKKILQHTMDLAMENWKELIFSTHPNLQDV